MYRPVTIEEPQLISQAALAWNLDLQDWTGLGNRIYRLDTSEGKFVLKATFFPKAEFSYIQRAQQHLWRQGFQQIAPPIPLEEGVFLFPWQDCSYFLSPFLAGEEADYHDLQTVSCVARALAKLHLAARGFHCDCYPQRLKWGGMLTLCRQKQREMAVFAQQAGRYQPLGLPELLYPQGLPLALQEAQTAIALLESYYPLVDQDAQLQSGFCHHDLTAGNLLLDSENKVQFIDFDYCISDFRGHDVANFLNRLLKHSRWQTELAKKALDAYESVYPFCFAERQVVSALLHFPQVFWQAGLARYVEGWVPEEKISRRLRMWRDEFPLRQQALTEMDRFLQREGDK